eukprot:snap_masked-scaffold931_size79642-processed-gene-0.3 protein:Tk04721 transcript:snap_masked-scaffold931_size79642-processed-gene-0.3-mRNA-1 annotation:"putative ferroportin"
MPTPIIEGKIRSSWPDSHPAFVELDGNLNMTAEGVPVDVRRGGTPWKIFASRTCSAWGDRLWMFAGGLFMTKLDPSSLRLVAIYGFVTSMVVILLGAPLGNWIDRSGRMRSAKTLLIVQNLAVALSCAMLFWHFWDGGCRSICSWEMTALVAIAFGSVATLASVGSKILVEKDWVVIIAGGDDNRLATINATFRTIDLTCNVVAPILSGLVFQFTSYQMAAIGVGAWNLISMVVEYLLLASIYKDYPELAFKEPQTDSPQDANPSLRSKILESLDSWSQYLHHSVAKAGFSLACLYMTVLGFDYITWGYCISQCVSEAALGALVGLSGVVGILGSLAFPALRRTLGLTETGVLGMGVLVVTLLASVISVWLPGSPFLSTFRVDTNPDMDCSVPSYASVVTFLCGLVLARFGLWLADLAVTQILQERISANRRGALNGVQGSLNYLMDTFKFILVILLPAEESFGKVETTASPCSRGSRQISGPPSPTAQGREKFPSLFTDIKAGTRKHRSRRRE